MSPADNPRSEVSLLWKAAFSPFGQLRRGVWLKVDLSRCLQAIQREVVASDRPRMLSYLGSLFYGLCRILVCQTRNTCQSVALPQIENQLSNATRTTVMATERGRRHVSSAPAALTNTSCIFLDDESLRAFMDISQQIDAFSVEEEETTTARENVTLPFVSQTTIEEVFNPSQVDGLIETEIFFEQLYAQVSSVHFLEECQDLLEKHFGPGGGSGNQAASSPRFAQVHAHESSFVEEHFTDGDIGDNEYEPTTGHQTENLAVNQSPALNSFSLDTVVGSRGKAIKRKRRGGGLRVKRPRAKRLVGLALHAEEWRKFKNGYQYLRQEAKNGKLTEPGRLLAQPLMELFRRPAASTKLAPQLFDDDQQPFDAWELAQPTTSADASPVIEDGETVTNWDCDDYPDEAFPEYTPASEHTLERHPLTVPSKVMPLNRWPIPDVSRKRPTAIENVEAEDDGQLVHLPMMNLLKGALNLTATDVACNEPKTIPFRRLLTSAEETCSQKTAARAFFSLIHLVAKPDSGLQLYQRRMSRRILDKQVYRFSTLTISVKSNFQAIHK